MGPRLPRAPGCLCWRGWLTRAGWGIRCWRWRADHVNQDGASNGPATPNGPGAATGDHCGAGQCAVRLTDVVEARDGTTLDPLRQAILATYGQRPADRPLWLGPTKQPVIRRRLQTPGHGGAGDATALPRRDGCRRRIGRRGAVVDRRGCGMLWSAAAGRCVVVRDQAPTHVILEEAPAVEPSCGPWQRPGGGAVSVGRSAQALTNQARRLLAWLCRTERSLPMWWSLVNTRSLFDHRRGRGRRPHSLMEGAGLANRRARRRRGGPRPADRGRRHSVPGPGAVALREPSCVPPHRCSPNISTLAERAPRASWSGRCSTCCAGHRRTGGPDRRMVQPALWAVMVPPAECGGRCGLRRGHRAFAGGDAAAHGARSGRGWWCTAQPVAGAVGRCRGISLVGLWPAAGREVEPKWGDRPNTVAQQVSSVVLAGDGCRRELMQRCEAEGIRARRIDVDYASHFAGDDPGGAHRGAARYRTPYSTVAFFTVWRTHGYRRCGTRVLVPKHPPAGAVRTRRPQRLRRRIPGC